MNKALLSKWSWRLANERSSLWRMVICNKFDEDVGDRRSDDIRGGFGTGLWKEIRKERPTFSHNAAFSLGDGKRISF